MLIFTPTCHKANYEIYVPVIKKKLWIHNASFIPAMYPFENVGRRAGY